MSGWNVVGSVFLANMSKVTLSLAYNSTPSKVKYTCLSETNVKL